MLLFVILSLYSQPARAQADLTAAWPTRAYLYEEAGHIYTTFEPALVFQQDIVITGIKFKITNIPKDTAVDWVLNIARRQAPLMPHVTAVNSEVMALHHSRYSSGGTWQQNIDLSKTPLYMPSNTDINCFAPIFFAKLPSDSVLECSMTYRVYTYPEPRYRSIRFPYSDGPNLPSGKLMKSWYKSGSAYNLTIGGMIAFTSFGGVNTDATATNICLRTSASVNGALIKKVCYPDQELQKNLNFTNDDGTYSISPNWRVTPGNYMQATCQISTPGDCAIWAFIRIPDGDRAYPTDIITGGDFVPPAQLNNFCIAYVAYLAHGWFGATPAQKIERCNHLFDFTGYVP